MLINKIGNVLFLLAIVVGLIGFPTLGAWGEMQGINGEFSASVWCGLCIACLSIPCMGLMHYNQD